MLQTLNQDWEGVRNVTNIQTAHEEIGYSKVLVVSLLLLLVQTRNESQQKIQLAEENEVPAHSQQ